MVGYGENGSVIGPQNLPTSGFTGVASGVWSMGEVAEASRDGIWPNVITYTAATGGTVTDVGGYRYHTFNSSGTFAISSVGTSDKVDILDVSGGGSGASGSGVSGGGGGAGGHLETDDVTIAATSYVVTIGAGGALTSGSDSSVATLSTTSNGGGKGAGQGVQQGLTGGSGGGTGGNQQSTPGGVATPAGQGNNGGPNHVYNDYSAGGGGGAGGAGQRGTAGEPYGYTYTGGAGGAGKDWQSLGVLRGGGGGGGTNSNSGSAVGGIGGTGGGGNGDIGTSPGGNAQAGTVNTGGGSGGGRYGATGNGGSGVVIIRYLYVP